MVLRRIQSLFLSCLARCSAHDPYEQACERKSRPIEDYRLGYPRYSALVAAHKSFSICRRFSQLRARLLLLKQDKLSALEEQLGKLDQEERAALFLGSSRDDANEERKLVLANIDRDLAEYDKFLRRNHEILRFEAAEPRDVLSLQNWVNGNGCLSLEETDYLTHLKDLLNTSTSSEDRAATRLEAWVEDQCVHLFDRLRTITEDNTSNDPHVHIFSESLIRKTARGLILLITLVLLSVPVVICSAINSHAARVSVITIFLLLFLVMLSSLVNVKASELAIAGATYTTVLIVFVSGI